MNRIALILALILFAVPVSARYAEAGSWMMSQMRAQHALRKWEQKQAEFWKKFNTDMANAEKQVDTPFFQSGGGA